MKTLKKTLCLVLVFAMMMSVCVFSASAFKDDDAINYTEAVEVMVGLGIIDGFPEDDTFRPTETLTRAQACKLITYMLGAQDYAVAAESNFTDVPASFWGAGYIAYCAAEGIVAGYGDGKFGPNDTLTGYAWAKMLLCAVGFDAEEEGMTGSAWQIGVAKLAKAADLFDGNAAADKTKNCTREEAALYALNALQYSPNGKTSAYVVTDGNKVLYKGTDALTALIMKNSSETAKLELTTTSEGSIGSEVFGLTKITVEDAFGRKTVEYNNGKTTIKDKVVYASFPVATVLTYDAAVTAGKIAADLGCTKTADKVTLNFSGNTTLTTIEAGKADKTDVAVNGDNVLVYAAGEKTYDVVVIKNYVHELTKAEVIAAKPSKDITAGIQIGNYDKFETDEFAAGDVIVYTVKGDEIQSAVKADYVTGTITAKGANNAYIRIDGEKYFANVHTADFAKLSANAETTYTFYLDQNGYVGLVKEGEGPADVATSNFYVLDTASKAKGNNGTGDNLFDPTEGTAAYAQAKVIDLTTGEISVVDLGVVYKGGNYYYADKYGNATTKVVDGEKPYDGEAIYEYAVLESGDYVITEKAFTNKNVSTTKGSASVTVTGEKKNATSKTVVNFVELTVDKDGAVVSAAVTTTTGIANFKTTTYEEALVTYVKGSNGKLVATITVVAEKEAVKESVNYAIYAGEGETDVDGLVSYNFYKDGEIVTYTAAKNVTVSAKQGDVVTLSFTDGKITGVKVATGATKNNIQYVDDSFIITESDNAIYFADAYTVVDATADYAEGTIAVGDNLDIYTNDKGEIEFVVITGHTEAE